MSLPHETIVKFLEERELNESARRRISRVASHIANRHVGMIRLFESGCSAKENNKRNADLKADFKYTAYIIFPCVEDIRKDTEQRKKSRRPTSGHS